MFIGGCKFSGNFLKENTNNIGHTHDIKESINIEQIHRPKSKSNDQMKKETKEKSFFEWNLKRKEKKKMGHPALSSAIFKASYN